MEFNEHVFARQYYVVFRFIQHIAYNRGLKAVWDGNRNPGVFWASTVDSHLLLAAIDWCNVFGSRSGDMHWTKTTLGEIPKHVQEDFRQRVLSETSFVLEEWEKYQSDMMTFRNKFVSHVDLCEPFNDAIPSFDPALQVAYAYDKWVRDLSRPSIWEQPPLIREYEQLKAEASSVIRTFFPSSK